VQLWYGLFLFDPPPLLNDIFSSHEIQTFKNFFSTVIKILFDLHLIVADIQQHASQLGVTGRQVRVGNSTNSLRCERDFTDD